REPVEGCPDYDETPKKPVAPRVLSDIAPTFVENNAEAQNEQIPKRNEQSGPENLQAQADSDETQVEPQLDPNGMVPPQA
uniref:hypothetical protein n=1 Tax=Succinivibrio sp. TaxID=2053619 RepID=UPI003FEE7062